MPGIAPLDPPYDPATDEWLKKWMPPGLESEPIRIFRTLARHRELASRMRPLGSYLLNHGVLEPREREIVLHRTCGLAGAEYEWGVHAAAYGRPLGLTDEQLRSTATGTAADACWSPREALLVRLADELHETSTIGDELFAALETEFGTEEILELIVLAGWYHVISYVVNACRTEHEPWAERFAAA